VAQAAELGAGDPVGIDRVTGEEVDRIRARMPTPTMCG
jgi:hypothetical protein